MTRARRRDPETAVKINEVWQTIRWDGNYTSEPWREPFRAERIEAMMVVSDALRENAFPAAGADLANFAKRLRRPPFGPSEKRLKSQWQALVERVDDAIDQIRDRRAERREWYQLPPKVVEGRRKHHAVVIFEKWREPAFTGRGRVADTVKVWPVELKDVENLKTLRRWFDKQGGFLLGRVEMRREHGTPNVILYPLSGWARITIRPGQTRPRFAGHYIQNMAQTLNSYGFQRPYQYARKIYWQGYRGDRLDRELTSWAAAEAFAAKHAFRFRAPYEPARGFFAATQRT